MSDQDQKNVENEDNIVEEASAEAPEQASASTEEQVVNGDDEPSLEDMVGQLQDDLLAAKQDAGSESQMKLFRRAAVVVVLYYENVNCSDCRVGADGAGGTRSSG